MAENTLNKRELLNLPIESFQVDPNQPKKYFDEKALNELSKSIKKHGVLQPIIYRIDIEGKYIIIAGERRFQAAKKAGLTEIPAIYNDGNFEELAMIENMLRQDLNPIEEAEGLKSLKDKYNYTDKQLAAQIGKGRSTINEILKINDLPETIKNDCRNNNTLPKSSLLKIARTEDKAKQIKMYEKLVKHKVNGEKVEDQATYDKIKFLFMWSKSVNNMLSDTEFVIDDANRESIKNDLSLLRNNINMFLEKNNLR